MDEEEGTLLSDSITNQRKPAGWKAMPYILGNEAFERLATFGLMSNFMVYLEREYHMDQVQAATIINTWSALTNFAPIIGAFISDALVGKFSTIVFGIFVELLARNDDFDSNGPGSPAPPPPCATLQDYYNSQQNPCHCLPYTDTQITILLLGLCWLSIGTGGIRPCSVSFSIDQFDVSKNDVGWALGFAIPTFFMLFAIILIFVGTKIYVYVTLEGSVFSDVAQVFVAAYKNRRVRFSGDGENGNMGTLHDSLLVKNHPSDELVLTDQFRFLNKAAAFTETGINRDGCTKKWRVCSVQLIETVKCIISIIPIFASSIIGFLAMNQQQTFTVSQALKMDLRVPGTNYRVPAGSLSAISLVTIGIWLPFYDAFLVSPLEKLTKQEGGITLLQKVGIGNIFSILTMLAAGFIEKSRRDSALSGSELSVFWLTPQLVLVGFSQVFSIVGLTEFFNKQVPDNMRSIGNSLLYLALSAASWLSSLVIRVVHDVSGKCGGQNWLTNDVDTSRLDYFYFLISGLSTLNFMFLLFCAHRYRYRNM